VSLLVNGKGGREGWSSDEVSHPEDSIFIMGAMGGKLISGGGGKEWGRLSNLRENTR